jgi:ATP-binding cassette, subfamily B, bacterial MsbA
VKDFYPYFKYLKPVAWTFVLALFCGLIFGVSSGFGIPFITKQVFPRIFPQESDTAVAPGALEDPSLLLLAAAAAFIPLAFAVRGLSGFLNTYLINVCGIRVLEDIRADIFAKYQSLPLGFFHKQSSGDLVSRCLADTNAVQHTLTTVANDLVKQPLTLIGAVGFLTYASMQDKQVFFLLVCMGVVPLCIVPIQIFGKKMLRRSRQTQKQLGSMTGFVSENLRSAREIRAFNLEESQKAYFSKQIRKLLVFQLKVVKYKKGLPPVVEVIASFGLAFAFLYAYNAGLAFETFLPLFIALYMSYDPIKKLGMMQNQLQKGRGALDRLDEIMREPVTIRDPEQPHPVGRLAGEIVFDRVSFAYDEQGAVLRGINTRLQSSKVYALVGPSGAGKSTFANIIPRFFDPTEGSVRIDGIDIRQMRLRDLRNNIALVSQEPVLFDDTIFNNILLGRPDATRNEVIKAAESAYAREFVEAFDQGFETPVHESGTRLSGGQRQRIALARAFLKDAPILILDEATSALDSESEEKIKNALRSLIRGRTVLMIAHRFSTLSLVDTILFFEFGRITAEGSHEDLYENCPAYRNLYQRQNVEAG